jgi:hypothetical protein
MANEDKAKKVADRIAERLRADESYGNYEGGWDDLQAKLDRMYQEMQAGGRITPATAAAPAGPATSVGKAKHAIQSAPASHSSQERFNINEAVVEELVEFFEKEKACSFEPNGKPCDHCAMCSSRGF